MLDLDNAVLLPIDMQKGFDEPSWPKRWNDKTEDNGRALLDAWRKTGRPIVHVRHDSAIEGSTLSPAHRGNAHREGFLPVNGERLVSKSVNSAFIGTDLDLHLRRIGAKSIIVFGISTDMCVSTTIRMGANMGWPMVLVEDACDCFEQAASDGSIIPARQMHEAHVATLRTEFCTVVTTKELLGMAG
ncbi:MAG: cysteine hydrolase family protein [Rhizobiaceae bacterium]